MRHHNIAHYVIGILCFFAVFAALPPICSGSPPFTLQVKGIQIISDPYKNDAHFRPFGMRKKVSLACLLFSNEGGFIRLDLDRSKIEKLQDNLGTDLSIDNETNKNGFRPLCPISKDLKALKFTINGLRLPEEGATSIIASGVLAVKAGYNLKIL